MSLLSNSSMHNSTTAYAQDILSHAKQLIKQLDDAWFSYDRAWLVSSLTSLTHAHKNSHEEQTVQQLEKILATLETLEHAYHDQFEHHLHDTHTQEIQSLLWWFQQKVSALWWASYGKRINDFMKKRYTFFSWFEICLFWILLLFAGAMIIGTATYLLRYVLIFFVLCTLGVLLLKRLWTWGWRIAVALICVFILFCRTLGY